MPLDELATAASSGGLDDLRAAMKLPGVRPDAKKSQIALVCAVESNQYDAVAMLLEWGVTADSSDDTRRRALHLACAKGFDQVASQLLKAGAEYLTPDHEGNLPLSIAVTGNHLQVCKALLKAGAKLAPGQSCKGLAAIVGEVQLEVLVQELKEFAAGSTQIEADDLLAADEQVWKAQKEHMRLLALREEQKAGGVVVDLEKKLDTENAAYRKHKLSEDAMAKELTDIRVNLQTVETSCGLMKQQLDAAEVAAKIAMAEEAEADVEYKAMMAQMALLKSEQEAADREIAAREKAAGDSQSLLKTLLDEANSMRLANRDASEELKAESAMLRGWERDKEAAAAFTAQAHELLGLMPMSPKGGAAKKTLETLPAE